MAVPNVSALRKSRRRECCCVVKGQRSALLPDSSHTSSFREMALSPCATPCLVSAKPLMAPAIPILSRCVYSSTNCHSRREPFEGTGNDSHTCPQERERYIYREPVTTRQANVEQPSALQRQLDLAREYERRVDASEMQIFIMKKTRGPFRLVHIKFSQVKELQIYLTTSQNFSRILRYSIEPGLIQLKRCEFANMICRTLKSNAAHTGVCRGQRGDIINIAGAIARKMAGHLQGGI